MRLTGFDPLPLSRAALERYRVKTKRRKQATLVGGHQMRRKGQSLEFHDYRQYIPGDDIRHVDWRASMRRGGIGDMRDLVVKEFTAEEHMTLVISIDTRDSMQLPRAMPKVLIAAWVAEAISRIALRSDDRVVLHRLFGKGRGGIETLRGTGGLSRLGGVLNRFNAFGGTLDEVNLGVLDRYLPPTAVWLILTDFYFDMEREARKLGMWMTEAQDGWRWIIAMDLDSWSYEKNYLGVGARKIEGPGVWDPNRQFDITSRSLGEIGEGILSHKRHFHRMVKREGYDRICWEWPEVKVEPGDFFEHRFGEDRVLQRLFMKGKG
ncbi:MAG: DUF58 domain-containing protein [bacterium]|nr:DUF58 domain-containing protein [bacterium]